MSAKNKHVHEFYENVRGHIYFVVGRCLMRYQQAETEAIYSFLEYPYIYPYILYKTLQYQHEKHVYIIMA